MSYNYQKTYHGKFRIPEHMVGAVRRYLEDHKSPGSFLEAVISNDLSEAVGAADIENLENLPAYVMFFYNEAPGNCWGTKDKYLKWIANEDTTDC